jgi:hypothetical protein
MSELDSNTTDIKFSSARRDFVKLATGGMALMAATEQASAKLTPIPPGIKIGVSAGQPTPENLRYLKQLGVTWVSLAPNAQNATAEAFTKDARTMGSFRFPGVQHREWRRSERQPA